MRRNKALAAVLAAFVTLCACWLWWRVLGPFIASL